MERIMKTIQSALVSAALMIGMAAPAQAATTDPEVIIYRFPGVHDDGGASFVGVATVFHCTNFSGVLENLRFVTRGSDTTLKTNGVVGIPHLATKTVVTHSVTAYAIDGNLTTGLVAQGTTAIAATSTNIICTAMTIDAAASKPTGLALRGIRFSPVPGSQE
jgi:hypothetical protein